MRGPVVFFDGVCNLCNGLVNFLIDRDPSGRLLFAPLQGPTFRHVREAHPVPEELASIVLMDEVGVHLKSKAALRILTALGGVWRLASILYLVPRPLRDLLYDFVAKRRYPWFGKSESCRIPTPELRARFLD